MNYLQSMNQSFSICLDFLLIYFEPGDSNRFALKSVSGLPEGLSRSSRVSSLDHNSYLIPSSFASPSERSIDRPRIR